MPAPSTGSRHTRPGNDIYLLGELELELLNAVWVETRDTYQVLQMPQVRLCKGGRKTRSLANPDLGRPPRRRQRGLARGPGGTRRPPGARCRTGWANT